MRVALFTDGIYPYVIGGMQKHSFYLAKYFALNKVDVDLYHTAKSVSVLDNLNCFSEEEKKFIQPWHKWEFLCCLQIKQKNCIFTVGITLLYLGKV